MESAKVLGLLNFMTVLVLSTACHEFAHAWLADRFGDDTPRRHGRMTFNPFAHVHPIYTIALPAVLFWTSGAFMAAAWTPVNPSKMRRPRLHGLLVSLGGPAANLLVSLGAFLVLAAGILAVGGIHEGTPKGGLRVLDILYMAVQLNLFLAMFNLIPIPPLDGSDLVGFLLPARLRLHWEGFRRYAWIVFLILLATNVLDRVLGPATRIAGSAVEFAVAVVNGVARG
jgi:Zn-dependent protease